MITNKIRIGYRDFYINESGSVDAVESVGALFYEQHGIQIAADIPEIEKYSTVLHEFIEAVLLDMNLVENKIEVNKETLVKGLEKAFIQFIIDNQSFINEVLSCER